MITSVIAAKEGREVATIDLPGAFLHAYTDEEVIMFLKGRLAELLVLVQPQLYHQYVTYDKKGEPMLYVKLNKALYDMACSGPRCFST